MKEAEPEGCEFEFRLGRQIFLTSKFCWCFWLTLQRGLLAKTGHTAGTLSLGCRNIAHSRCPDRLDAALSKWPRRGNSWVTASVSAPTL